MTTVESAYYDFMNFDRESSSSGLSHYLQYFDDGPVLELASGRGDFLRLLLDRGIAARGVDIDEGMVADSIALGANVHLGDAIEHLQQQPDASLAGLFCAHFLEHLASEDVARMYLEAGRVLAPGGTFVAAVPSAASLSVLRYDFWRDPTHVRFYDPLLLGFFAAQAGLTVVESGGNPLNDPGPPPTLIPVDLPTAPSVAAELGEILARMQEAQARTGRVGSGLEWVRRRARGKRGAGDGPPTTAELSEQLIHVASHLDQRIQHVQHHAYTLTTAYRNLLAALFPPNEVYVVARKLGEGASVEPPRDGDSGPQAAASDD